MPKEMPNFENNKEPQIVKDFKDAMKEEHINKALRDKVLEIMNDPDFVQFTDEYMKDLIKNYDNLTNPQAIKEANFVVKEYIKMIEKYESSKKVA